MTPILLTPLRALLLAVVLRTWALMHVTPDAGIADAIATACEEAYRDGAPDAPLLAATMSVYAWRESSFRPGAIGDSGQSFGVWQTPTRFTRWMTVAEQARYWVRVVRASSLASVDSSSRRAGRRLAIAAAAVR